MTIKMISAINWCPIFGHWCDHWCDHSILVGWLVGVWCACACADCANGNGGDEFFTVRSFFISFIGSLNVKENAKMFFYAGWFVINFSRSLFILCLVCNIICRCFLLLHVFLHVETISFFDFYFDFCFGEKKAALLGLATKYKHICYRLENVWPFTVTCSYQLKSEQNETAMLHKFIGKESWPNEPMPRKSNQHRKCKWVSTGLDRPMFSGNSSSKDWESMAKQPPLFIYASVHQCWAWQADRPDKHTSWYLFGNNFWPTTSKP